jgi:hypothetical protein
MSCIVPWASFEPFFLSPNQPQLLPHVMKYAVDHALSHDKRAVWAPKQTGIIPDQCYSCPSRKLAFRAGTGTAVFTVSVFGSHSILSSLTGVRQPLACFGWKNTLGTLSLHAPQYGNDFDNLFDSGQME